MDPGTPPLVRMLFEGIARDARPGSSILFDIFPQSMVDGAHPSAVARNIRRHVETVGEPFLFGAPEEGMKELLTAFGFKNIRCITDREYMRVLFGGDAEDRATTGLLTFCYAEV